MLHIWFNQTQSHSLISNRLLPPSIPLLLRATSHDRLFSCLWLLIIEIFLARFRLHLKNVFKAKAFSINLPTASQPQKKNRHRILFIYIEQGEQVAPSLLPLTYLLPRPWSQSVKRRGGKKGWEDGRMRNADENAGDRLPQSKQIKRQGSEAEQDRKGQGQRARDSTLYVDFICNSRESRNLHKQIEFCIHFLCPFSKQNIKGLVCLARRKRCYSIFQRTRGRQTDWWTGRGGNVKRSRMCRGGTYHSPHVAWSFFFNPIDDISVPILSIEVQYS